MTSEWYTTYVAIFTNDSSSREFRVLCADDSSLQLLYGILAVAGKGCWTPSHNFSPVSLPLKAADLHRTYVFLGKQKPL